MRSRVMLALVLGFAQAHVQAQQLGPASVRDSYGLVSLPSELRERQIDLTLANHSVVSGETLESILLSQGVVPTPRALGLVLEANPDLENVNQILAGTELLVPQIEGIGDESMRFYIGAPTEVTRAGRAVRELSFQAATLESPDMNNAFSALASTFQDALHSRNGLPAGVIAHWRENAESIVWLAKSDHPEDLERAIRLAHDANKGLHEAVSLSRSGMTTTRAVLVMATNPPDGGIPASCKIRYALFGFAAHGHVVESQRTKTFSASACHEGREMLSVGFHYGIWAEWLEAGAIRRSQIKDFYMLSGFDWPIDLPLLPFE